MSEDKKKEDIPVVSEGFDLRKWANQALNDLPSPEALAKLKDQLLSKGNEAASAILENPTVKNAPDTLNKLKDDMLLMGNETVSAILAHPTTQSIIAQANSTFNSLEQQAHRSFCTVLNDPCSQKQAVLLQELHKQTTAALEYLQTHPDSVEAEVRYDELVKQSNIAYEAFLKANPEARNFVSTAEKISASGVALCKNQPVLCGLLAAGMAELVFPGSALPVLLGYGKGGPRPGSLAATIHRKIHGLSEGSMFSTMQKWGKVGFGMVGLSTGTKAATVDGPLAALFGVGLWENWTLQSCCKYKKGGAKL